MANDKPTKIERDLLAIKQGAQQVLAGGKTFSYKGTSYDLASFTQLIDGHLAPYVTVRQMRTLMEKGMVDRRANKAGTQEFVRLVKFAAAASYGESSLEFAQLGFQPNKKATPLTPEQKQHKLESLRATRAARHTMGKRQKKAVKGDVGPAGGNAGSPVKPEAGSTTGTIGSNVTKP